MSNGVDINIFVMPYTGPGSYMLSNKYFSDNSKKRQWMFRKAKSFGRVHTTRPPP